MTNKLKWKVAVVVTLGAALTTAAVLYVVRDAPFTGGI